MSLSSRSNQYGKVLGDWNIRKEIGKGSKGTIVYKINREGWGRFEETYALKAIPIINERGDYERLSDRSKEEYQRALSERVDYAIGEVKLMSIVGNHTNIVDYKDYNTVKWEEENEFGCDLLIRMELLHDLRSELKRGHILSEAEVIRIGMDICSALIVCHGKNILHRDIKPENIFFNDDGDYKLGDFGISRILEQCPSSHASTGVGTPEYAAPEQSAGKYDMNVDIYSLGLVLYELTNQNRLPFAESSYVRPEEIGKRIHARTLPKPCDASDGLAKVILIACAHEPADRYQSAQEMLDALDRIRVQKPVEPNVSTGTKASKVPNPVPIGSNYDTLPASPDFAPAVSSPNSAIQMKQANVVARGTCGKSAYWALYENGFLNIEGSGVIEKISLPDNWVQDLNNRKNKIVSVQIADGITSIGNSVFSEWIFLKEVYVPESVVSFGEFAFSCCVNLLEITIPQSVESIGSWAFSDCRKLREISVADGNAVFTSINGVLFNRVRKKLKLLSYPAGKLVKRYVVPDGVTSIGVDAFDYCDNLIEVILPDSISYIETIAFNGCRSLQQITFLGNAPQISEKAFYRVTATAYYPANDSSWTEEIRQSYGGKITWVAQAGSPTADNPDGASLDDALDRLRAKILAEHNFSTGTEASKAPSPASIGSNYDTLPASPNFAPAVSSPNSAIQTKQANVVARGTCGHKAHWTLYENGFLNIEGSGSIGKIALPDSWTQYYVSFGNHYNNDGDNKIVTVQIADGITSIEECVFRGWRFLEEVDIPESVVSFGMQAFSFCKSLLEITIPQSVTFIGSNALSGCDKLQAIHVKPGNRTFTDIDGVLFSCDKTKLLCYPTGRAGSKYVVPDSVTAIEGEAFDRCDNLIEVILPDSISYIKWRAFHYCCNLQQITIPKNVIKIENYAFGMYPYPSSLINISFLGNAPQISEGAFYGVTATAYYPANDSSWTEEIRQNYGGRITWVAQAGSPTVDDPDGTSAMRQSAISEEVHELFQKASVGDASAQNAFAFGRYYFEDDGKDGFVEPDAVVSIKPEEEDTGNTEPAEVVKVRSVLQEMHQIRLWVEDETISAGISRVEEIGQKIVEYIRNHPERIPQARQFINVYVPLTINIFKNYASLSRVGISGKNVDAVLSDVPRTMGLISSAFERQLDKLFDSEALDISSDIAVMKHMLEQDGFVGGLEV